MIDFKRITIGDRSLHEKYMSDEGERGCEYSFANLYLWGRQTMAEIGGCLVFFSQFNRRSVYPFPIGNGDKRAAIDALICDAAERGIPCRITGITEKDRRWLEETYPETFRVHSDRDSHDYVYNIDDLADTAGKKYHKKRGHLRKFEDAYPDYFVAALDERNVADAEALLEKWYSAREDEDFMMEKCAVKKALRDREALGLEIFLLYVGETAVALSVSSRIDEITFDVHFEKALTEFDGAYAMINRESARYLREKYPEVKFLNREEDMGIEGLRKAKSSYYPHHMVEKWWAHLTEDGYDY